MGFAIVLVGAAVLLEGMIRAFPIDDPRMSGALIGGSVAALATALGTLPVLLALQFSQRTYDTMLGFGAGVMLAACSFSLIIPALAAAKSQGAGSWGAGGIVGSGILLGALLLLVIDRLVPHEHFIKGREGPQALAMKRVWLFVLAICLHNLPEGLAIGVAYAGTDPVAALALTTGIAIQDVPEGLVVALALRNVGYGPHHLGWDGRPLRPGRADRCGVRRCRSAVGRISCNRRAAHCPGARRWRNHHARD